MRVAQGAPLFRCRMEVFHVGCSLNNGVRSQVDSIVPYLQ